MTSTTSSSTTSAAAVPTGRTGRVVGIVLTVLLTAFLVFDFVPKLLSWDVVVEASGQLGYPPATVPVMGALLLVCTVLYLVPRTSILGAVLLTGYLGGAMSAQLRVEAPLFSTTLFSVYLGIVAWVALYLRSPRVRATVRRTLALSPAS